MGQTTGVGLRRGGKYVAVEKENASEVAAFDGGDRQGQKLVEGVRPTYRREQSSGVSGDVYSAARARQGPSVSWKPSVAKTSSWAGPR